MGIVDDRRFLESLIDKDISIVQKDGFIKHGLCFGYDSRFLFLKFNNGEQIAINFDDISQIKVKK